MFPRPAKRGEGQGEGSAATLVRRLQICASVPIARHRLLDPAKVFVRAGLILCGVAVTWMCAAFGLLASDMIFRGGCRLPTKHKPALYQVRTIEHAVARYQIDHDKCPETMDDLIDNAYVDHNTFVDPWGTPIRFTCIREDIRVDSAGADRAFGTADDVMNERWWSSGDSAR